MKAATLALCNIGRGQEISIHAAREGGDFSGAPAPSHEMISIHAAREGGDGYIEFIRRKGEISIHAAREGGDCTSEAPATPKSYFNPRRP